MPTPLGHALGGYAVARVAGASFRPQAQLPWWLILPLSVAPDFDYIPGILVGNLGVYHHHATHSLLAAVALGAVAGVGYRLRRRPFVPFFFAASAVVASHLVLDMLTPGRGLELFWPVEVRVGFPFGLLNSALLHVDLPMVDNLLLEHNLRTFATELLAIGPLALLAHFLARRRQTRL